MIPMFRALFRKLSIFALSFRDQEERSKLVAKNAMLSLFSKGGNIVASLLIIPLTINYVDPIRYGIWMTISSIIAWVTFFDLGIGNGFRNKYAEAVVVGDFRLARKYVATAYICITSVVVFVLLVALVCNTYMDWGSILNVDSIYTVELRSVFAIVVTFTGINMIVSLFSTLLVAEQKIGMASLLGMVGQYASLIVIFILTKISAGSLVYLAWATTVAPPLFMMVITIYMFRNTNYKRLSPRWKDIDTSLIRGILNLGGQFFLIYLCLIVIFQLSNLVLSRELGPLAVTQYSIASKYMGLLYMLISTAIAPVWSAFTEAYHKKDFIWMKKTIEFLERVWLGSIVFGIIMQLAAPYIYIYWIGKEVSITSEITFGVFLYTISQTIGTIYMFMINGIGTIRIQLLLYVFFAIVSYPCLLFFTQQFGILGVTVFPTLVYLVQAVFGKLQLSKLLRERASGVWIK